MRQSWMARNGWIVGILGIALSVLGWIYVIGQVKGQLDRVVADTTWLRDQFVELVKDYQGPGGVRSRVMDDTLKQED